MTRVTTALRRRRPLRATGRVLPEAGPAAVRAAGDAAPEASRRVALACWPWPGVVAPALGLMSLARTKGAAILAPMLALLGGLAIVLGAFGAAFFPRAAAA